MDSNDFIEYVVEYQKETESPNDYWRWAAIAGIAALLRDRVCYTCQIGKIYPNIYVVILADSGATRKAAPCKFIGKLIQSIGCTKFINGRSSMQAVIKELAAAYTLPTGQALAGASALMYSEELSSFVVQDPAAIPLLIDLYDYHETWSSSLVGTGQTKLKEVCVSMLAASNTDLLKDVFTDRAMKGGLLGRTFFISANSAKKRKSLLDLKQSELSVEPIIAHVKRINALKGEIGHEPDAKELYNDWYYNVPQAVLDDKQGFGSRIGTHVLKLAIILAAARTDFAMKLTYADIAKAIKVTMPFLKTYNAIMAGVGASENSQQMTIILKTVLSTPGYHVRHLDLMQRHYADFHTPEQFDQIIIMLTQAGLLQCEGLDGDLAYKLTKKGMEVFVNR